MGTLAQGFFLTSPQGFGLSQGFALVDDDEGLAVLSFNSSLGDGINALSLFDCGYSGVAD